MAQMTFPKLVLRGEKGSQLTHEELDGNFSKIRTFVKSLAATIGVALNPDGTLLPDSVGADQLQNRIVGQANMAGVNLFVAEDAGATNALAISFTPAFTAYADKMVFWVKVANTNTGATTLSVDGISGPVAVKKFGATALEPGDLVAGSVAVFVYFAGVFHLISGISQSSSSGGSASTGFSGIQQYTSPETAIEPPGTVQFDHGLIATPNLLEVFIVCIVPDIIYNVGQRVPLVNVIDSSLNPAFTVYYDATSVFITRNAGTLFIGGSAITESSWRFVVEASITTEVSANIFPALSFMVKEPEGAMADADNLFFMQYGRHNAGKIYTQRLALSTNVITPLTPAASNPNHRYCNIGKFRRANGSDDFIYTSSTGLFRLPLIESGVWQPVMLCTLASAYPYKPAWIEESAGSITHVYVVTSSYAVQSVSGLIMRDVNVAANTITTLATAALDLTSATILNADLTPGNTVFRTWHQAGSSADVLLFQYNPLKKRIYVITNEVSMLHIFELHDTGAYTDPSSILEWWNDAGRLSKLKYVKTIGVPGSGDSWSNYNREKMFVDYDLSNGQERALILARNGSDTFGGSVTRVPWKEA